MRRSLLFLLIPTFLAVSFFPAYGLGGSDQRRRYYYEDIFLPFYKKDKKTGVYSQNRPGAPESSFTMPKPAGTFRVFVIGGSIAHRYMNRKLLLGPEPQREKSSLQQALEKSLPGRTIEALDCGMGGYDSFRETMVLEEVLEYDPDLVILFTGHNEAVGSPPIPLWILHAQDRLKKIAAFQTFLEKLKKKRGYIDGAVETGPKKRDADFEKNLRAMLRYAKSKRVPILVAVPPLNLKDSPPPVRIPLTDPDFATGWIASLRGERELARQALQRSLSAYRERKITPNWQHHFLARDYEREGKLREARYHYRASLETPFPGRCSGACPETIRNVTRSEQGLLLELDRRFEDVAVNGIPDGSIFTDSVHWNLDYNGLVSEAVIKKLKAALPKINWSTKSPKPWKPSKSVAALETLTTLRYAGKMMATSPLLEWTAVHYLDIAGMRMPEAIKTPKAFREIVMNDDARRNRMFGLGDAQISDGRLAWYFAELALHRGNHARALKLYTNALKHKETPLEAHYGRAIAAALVNDTRRSEESLGILENSGNEFAASILRKALAH